MQKTVKSQPLFRIMEDTFSSSLNNFSVGFPFKFLVKFRSCQASSKFFLAGHCPVLMYLFISCWFLFFSGKNISIGYNDYTQPDWHHLVCVLSWKYPYLVDFITTAYYVIIKHPEIYFRFIIMLLCWICRSGG